MLEWVCLSCDLAKPLSTYYPDPSTKRGFKGVCKDCHKKRVRERRWSLRKVKLCVTCGKDTGDNQGRRFCSICRESHAAVQMSYSRVMRYRVMQHYSGSLTPFCACCGESRLEFMSIDHINGGGLKHRREVGYGSGLYRWLKNNGYPDGFRVLCFNCNQSRGHYKYCPHEREREMEFVA